MPTESETYHDQSEEIQADLDRLTPEEIEAIKSFASGPAKTSNEIARSLTELGYLTSIGHGAVAATAKAHELVNYLEKKEEK